MRGFMMLVNLAVILALVSLERTESKSHRSDIPIEIYDDYLELKESNGSSQVNNKSTEATAENKTRHEPKEKSCQCVGENTTTTTTTTLETTEDESTAKTENTTEDFKPSTSKLSIQTITNNTNDHETSCYKQPRPWYSECEKISMRNDRCYKLRKPGTCLIENDVQIFQLKLHAYDPSRFWSWNEADSKYDEYECINNGFFDFEKCQCVSRKPNFDRYCGNTGESKPDPKSIYGFQTCIYGRVFTKKCRDGTCFDPKSRKCDYCYKVYPDRFPHLSHARRF